MEIGLSLSLTSNKGVGGGPRSLWSAAALTGTNGDPLGSWGSAPALTATSTARPLYQTAIPSVLFDGVNDCMVAAASYTDLVGSVVLAFKTGATAFATRGAQSIFTSANDAAANEWFEIGITSEGRVYVEANAAGTKHTVIGSDFLDPSTSYIVGVFFDGVDYFLEINGVEQNPLMIENIGTFAWFGDVVAANNIVIGGTVTSAGLVRPFQGDVMQIEVYSRDLTA